MVVLLFFQLHQITMAIVCRCFRLQRAIAHRLAVDLSSNSRNDGMQKGIADIEKNIGRNIDGQIAEFILVPTTHPASSSIITKFLNCSFECVEKSHARDRALRPRLRRRARDASRGHFHCSLDGAWGDVTSAFGRKDRA
jgi:hypothetical protein